MLGVDNGGSAVLRQWLGVTWVNDKSAGESLIAKLITQNRSKVLYDCISNGSSQFDLAKVEIAASKISNVVPAAKLLFQRHHRFSKLAKSIHGGEQQVNWDRVKWDAYSEIHDQTEAREKCCKGGPNFAITSMLDWSQTKLCHCEIDVSLRKA